MARLPYFVLIGVLSSSCSSIRVLDDRRFSKEGVFELGCKEVAVLEITNGSTCVGDIEVFGVESQKTEKPRWPTSCEAGGTIVGSGKKTILVSARATSGIGGRVSAGGKSIWLRSRCERSGFIWARDKLAHPGNRLPLTPQNGRCRAIPVLLDQKNGYVFLADGSRTELAPPQPLELSENSTAEVCVDAPCTAQELIRVQCGQ